LTSGVLYAMMRSATPFYIALNSLMEALFVPFVIFLNWNVGSARRWLAVAATVASYAC